MGINFSSFNIARRALQVNQLGIAVTGKNVANVNTPGYTRQQVQTVPDTGGPQFGGEAVRAIRDEFLESRLNTETANQGRLSAKHETLAQVESIFNESDSSGGISSAINNFFGSFRDLEARPTSLTARSITVEKGNALGQAFQTTRSRLSELRQVSDTQLRATVNQVNSLAEQVADLNKKISIAKGSGGSALELEDQRNTAVRQLSELAGTKTTTDENGLVAVTFADGRALVLSGTAHKLNVVNTPPNGLASVEFEGQTADINNGTIKGLQDAISEVGTRITDLDLLAASIADRVNTLSTSGIDLNGNAGAAFFNVPAGGVTAANLSVASAVKADPKLVVAGAAGAGTGDGSVARSIANLLSDTSSTSGVRSGSFSSIYAGIVAEVGSSVKTADDALQIQQTLLKQTEAQRDAVSGVSLDEEAINMLQYQRAYEAAAKFLKIADEMTQTIMALGQ